MKDLWQADTVRTRFDIFTFCMYFFDYKEYFDCCKRTSLVNVPILTTTRKCPFKSASTLVFHCVETKYIAGQHFESLIICRLICGSKRRLTQPH